MSDFATALLNFGNVFLEELRQDLQSKRSNADMYAYAIDAPSDPSNLCIASAVATKSSYAEMRKDISSDADAMERLLLAVTDRFTDPNWDYTLGKRFEKSNALLQELQRNHFASIEQRELDSRMDAVYDTLLRQMKKCKVNGELESKWLNLIVFSDHEDPITRKSFNRLNSFGLRSRLWLLYNAPTVFYLPIAGLCNLGSRLLGRRTSG
jgi:hypothetical protein